jgi:hypothetical protein
MRVTPPLLVVVLLLAEAATISGDALSHPHLRAHSQSSVGRAVRAARARSGAVDAESDAFDQVLQVGMPAGLPSRSDRSPRPDGPVLNILDFNATNDGTADVSTIIVALATQHPPRPPTGPKGSGGSRTVLFPPGIYLFDPPVNVTSGGSVYRKDGGPFSLPAHLALELAEGAVRTLSDTWLSLQSFLQASARQCSEHVLLV